VRSLPFDSPESIIGDVSESVHRGATRCVGEEAVTAAALATLRRLHLSRH